MAGRPAPSHGSRITLAAIRTVHSAIFLVELASILWLVATGITGRRDRSTGIAAGMVAVEAAVFVLNRRVCPLTPLAERYGAERGTVSDIFLPDPVARTIPVWSSALLVVAATLHLRHLPRSRPGRPVRRSGRASSGAVIHRGG